MTVGGKTWPASEDLAIYSSLIFAQLLMAVLGVTTGKLLSSDVKPFAIAAYAGLVSAAVLTPFAFFIERSRWPRRLTHSLVARLLLSSFGIGCAYAGLTLMGVRETSPPIQSAMANLAPALIFLIAWSLRLEKVALKSKYSRAKIIGTLICLGGAMVMSLVQGPPLSDFITYLCTNIGSHRVTGYYLGEAGNQERIIGYIYLIVATFMLSCCMILQATTMTMFPAPLSLCTIVCFFGAIFSTAVQLIADAGFVRGTWSLSALDFVEISLLGIGMNVISMSIQTWAMQKRGPVLAVIFNPISTVGSAILSSIFLGDVFHVGSLAGVVLIFTGLYFVMWAKSKEAHKSGHGEGDEIAGAMEDATTQGNKSSLMQGEDLEKPLLG